MPKDTKTKRKPEFEPYQRLADAFRTLRTLRAWEDEVISELERLSKRALPQRRSRALTSRRSPDQPGSSSAQ